MKMNDLQLNGIEKYVDQFLFKKLNNWISLQGFSSVRGCLCKRRLSSSLNNRKH